MAIKRIVDTSFWQDATVVDKYTVEDKYFLLYLMTNPHTRQCGIYLLPRKYIAFEMGYSLEVVMSLIKRFQDEYKNIVYSEETQEIAVLNAMKYNIVKGGKPVEDLIRKELSNIIDANLIMDVYKNMREFWSASSRAIDNSVKELFEEEIKARGKSLNSSKSLNANDNGNGNGNENEISSPLTSSDTLHDTYDDTSDKDNYSEIVAALAKEITPTPSLTWIDEIDGYLKAGIQEEVILHAIQEAVDNNVRTWNYVRAILRDYLSNNVKTMDDVNARKRKRKHLTKDGKLKPGDFTVSEESEKQLDEFQKKIREKATMTYEQRVALYEQQMKEAKQNG